MPLIWLAARMTPQADPHCDERSGDSHSESPPLGRCREPAILKPTSVGNKGASASTLHGDFPFCGIWEGADASTEDWSRGGGFCSGSRADDGVAKAEVDGPEHRSTLPLLLGMAFAAMLPAQLRPISTSAY